MEQGIEYWIGLKLEEKRKKLGRSEHQQSFIIVFNQQLVCSYAPGIVLSDFTDIINGVGYA